MLCKCIAIIGENDLDVLQYSGSYTLESAVPEKTRTLSGILHVYLKKKISMVGKKKSPYKYNRKKPQFKLATLKLKDAGTS